MRAATAIRGTVALAGVAMLLLLALATAPWARASIIYVCVAKRGGAVRIVSKAARCRKRESKEPWNTRGSTGATGAVSTGGAAGINGFNGVAGATGAAGANAETGSPGGAGETGATGVAGTTGATGAQGPAGPTGETGATGVAGTKGATGASGAAGPAGATGETGAVGPTGAGGAVGGYSVHQTPLTHITFTSGTEGSPITVVSRQLPAGNYIVTATVELDLANTTADAQVGVGCDLIDAPSEAGASVRDTAEWTTPVGVLFTTEYIANNSLPLTLAVSSPTRTSEISIACYVSFEKANGGEFGAKAGNASITAVQTTQNS